MRPELHVVRDQARRYREVATKKADVYPKALTASGLDGAWRVTISIHPEVAPFKSEFVRVARGEG